MDLLARLTAWSYCRQWLGATRQEEPSARQPAATDRRGPSAHQAAATEQEAPSTLQAATADQDEHCGAPGSPARARPTLQPPAAAREEHSPRRPAARDPEERPAPRVAATGQNETSARQAAAADQGELSTTPLATLRQVIAVYSTHPTAPLALQARCRSMSPSHFRAMEQQRQAIRVTAMRGSAFLIPTDSAAQIFSATRQPLDRLAANLRYGNLDRDTYQRLVPLVLDCCANPVTPSELRACARVPEDVYMVARILARQGEILRIGASLRTDQLKYVATRAWLGHTLEEIDTSAALAWLGREYLRAFGPARVADFAWWAGVPKRAAAVALATAETVELDGGLLLLKDDAAEFETVQPVDPEAVDVLPKWDSYTMGYAPDGRQRFVEDRYLRLAYTSVTGSPGATSGDGLPLVLRGGRAVATWSHRFNGNQLAISVSPLEPFEPDASRHNNLAGGIFEAVGELLSASSVTVRAPLQSP